MYRLLPAFAEAIASHTVLRTLLILLSLAGILLFLLPMGVGIVNTGNTVGLAAGVLLLLFSVFAGKIGTALRRAAESAGGRTALLTVTSLLLAGILYCVILSVMMLCYAHRTPADTPKAMIVLGCKVNGTAPSLMLSQRIRAAYDAMTENPELKAVVSGGQGPNEAISEAECMCRELVRLGIPRERILLEDQSTSTSENLRFSGKILAENGLNGTVLLVTDTFHEMRAQYLAQYEGIGSTAAIPAKTRWYLLPTYWVREWFGLAHAFVFGT